jgi:hypothetical protein
VIALAICIAAGCGSPTSPSGTPQASGVTPPTGAQGTTVTVTIAGDGFTIGDTAAVVITGSGVTVSNVRVQSATTAVATLTIARSAPLGSRKLTLTTSTGGTSPDLTFTIVPPAPTLTAISPTNATAGTSVSLTLTGTNFIKNATTVAVSGSGITVGQVTVQKSTALTVALTIGSGAAPGARDVTVKTAGGTTAARTLTITAPTTKPSAPSIGAFGASPSNITSGQNATLSWSGIENATTCSIDNGVGSVACGDASATVSPAVTTTYTLTATGTAGSAMAQATVTVTGTASGGGSAPPPGPAIGSFGASPSSITSGQSSTLAWSGITNATTCSIDRGVGNVACGNGSVNVTPTATTTYTLTATGDGGSVTATATVTVNAAPPTAPAIGSFGASPSSITSGQSSRLSWSGITNATSCSIDNGVGNVPCANGGRTVSPTSTTTYTLTATGAGGSVTATARVSVVAPTGPAIGSFAASPSSITSGGSSTLAWSGIINATTCAIDNGVGAVPCANGNRSVSPGATTTYTLTATGAGGSTTATATVTVSAPLAPAIGSFTANPATITTGQSSMLAWSGITNALSCSIDNGVGNVACANGSASVSPAATTTYTLTATGLLGSATATATVAVSGMGPMLADNRVTSRDDRRQPGLSRP